MNKFLTILAALDGKKVLSGAVVVGVVYYMLLFDNGASVAAEIAGMRSEVQKEEQKKKDTDATLQEEKRMKEAVGILSEQYQIISKKLPTQLSTFEINNAVESFAREASVRIKASKPGTPEKMPIVEEVALDVSIEGKYPELLQFVYNISVAERLTRVKSLNIKVPPKDQRGITGANLRMDGVVVGYRLAPEVIEDPKKAVAPAKPKPPEVKK